MTSLARMQRQMSELAELALEALPGMFDERTGFFSHKAVAKDGGYANGQPNVWYSTASLVGLLAQRRRPADRVLPLGKAFDAIHQAVLARGMRGELANMVWASAMAEDRRGEEALARLVDLDPRPRASAELGQSLFGLALGGQAYEPLRDRALRAARAYAAELLARFTPRADVFRASPRRRIPQRALIESQLSSFASQVYPLHGFAALHAWTGEPLPDAVGRVAGRIVDAQGPLGQWWWLYSVRRRRVLEGYPVYSVHQDGMAFMGLAELERLGVGRYSATLARGVNWIFGENELGVSLAERKPALIDRCIQRADADADAAYGLSRANFGRAILRSAMPWAVGDRTAADPARLAVLRECRSYHLGWLLYADSLVQAAGAPA
jgi:hypothetical protein